ncbi:lysozyme inhibitor LprI family protein [Caballeronia sp. RCC_10]|uniref:lysozyme inhibitor LprI family protein n=1 Tax=Caballeronia sp. RCC_10 TaxID=3239227 RepID=UPI003523F1C9
MKLLSSPRRFVRIGSTIVAITLGLGACGKDGSKSASGPPSDSYPGYQQVGASGDAAQLWFNSSDIARSGSNYVIHALKAFPQGYARFDVATNCRDATRRLPGTQYRADGTAEKEYPGNDGTVSAKSEPGMAELMSTACGIAMASRSIAGNFNVPAALELLYGPYDQSSSAARWEDAAVPSDLAWRENLQLPAGGVMRVKGVATFDFSEGGKTKKVLVTDSMPEDGGCHACTGLLGVAVFAKDGDKWKVESNHPYVASMGAMGSVGDRFDWVPAGDDLYALVVGGDDMHQGYQTVSTTAFVRNKEGSFVSVIDDGDTGTSDQETLLAQTTFIKGKNPSHYDVKVAISYRLPGKAVYVADHVYQYSGGKYVLTKRDDSPKFVETAMPVSDGSAQSVNFNPSSSIGPTPAVALAAATGPSFDCAKAKSDAERLICSDGDLASRDVELASLFVKAKAAVIDKSAFKERTRQQWNYRENVCHDRDCLVRWYVDQQAALSHIADTGRID